MHDENRICCRLAKWVRGTLRISENLCHSQFGTPDNIAEETEGIRDCMSICWTYIDISLDNTWCFKMDWKKIGKVWCKIFFFFWDFRFHPALMEIKEFKHSKGIRSLNRSYSHRSYRIIERSIYLFSFLHINAGRFWPLFSAYCFQRHLSLLFQTSTGNHNLTSDIRYNSTTRILFQKNCLHLQVIEL